MTLAAPTTIAAVLGKAPFEGAFGLDVNAYTRAAVRTWLCRCGWPALKANELEIDALRAVYADNFALNAEASKRGIPMVEYNDGQQHAQATYAPRNEKLIEYLARRGGPNPIMVRDVEPIEEKPLPLPEPAAKPAPRTDKAAQLAALLQEIAGERDTPLDEARVIDLIREHAPRPERVEHVHTIQIVSPAGSRTLEDKPRHEAFPEVLACVAAGLNVMLVGPAGAGKTHLCEQVAESLGRSFRFTGALDSPYKLLGFIDAQGRTVRTPYRESYEHGGVFLFDEIDASAPAALLAFNAGLANGQQDFPDACVRRHAEASFIASANTYGRGQDRVYVGRNQLDAASLDRFAVIGMDYDEALERALYGNTAWTARVHAVRAAVRSLNIRHVVSMRALDQGARLLAGGMKRDRVETLTLWKGLDAASVDKIKAEAR